MAWKRRGDTQTHDGEKWKFQKEAKEREREIENTRPKSIFMRSDRRFFFISHPSLPSAHPAPASHHHRHQIWRGPRWNVLCWCQRTVLSCCFRYNHDLYLSCCSIRMRNNAKHCRRRRRRRRTAAAEAQIHRFAWYLLRSYDSSFSLCVLMYLQLSILTVATDFGMRTSLHWRQTQRINEPLPVSCINSSQNTHTMRCSSSSFFSVFSFHFTVPSFLVVRSFVWLTFSALLN